MRPVEFFYRSAFDLLCRIRRRALERGGHWEVICVRPWHLRILKSARLGTLFVLFAAVEDV
ncbi:hypothetical protein [Streptomyces sp. NPDC050535]|uniref:hypothetical protein n=1 Tax=Streptomyces sp. NPDC050535 TaxID=3365626 RepID=UPI0037BBF28E